MRFALSCLFVFAFVFGFSQNNAGNFNLTGDVTSALESIDLQHPSSQFHSSLKPYNGPGGLKLDTALKSNYLALRPSGFDLLTSKKNKLYALPLLDLEGGADVLLQKLLPYAGAGIQVRYERDSNLTAQLSYFGGFAKFPFFLDTTLSISATLPEHGILNKNNAGTLSSFSNLTGYLSWRSKNKVFNLQAGRDKFFVGDGYRSVLLSDFTSPYPFLRIGATVWKLQYHVWYTIMTGPLNLNSSTSKLEKKYGTFHYLSYNINKKLALGVFENVVWRGSDTNQTRLYEINYLNPLVFYRPQEYSLGSPDNSMLGLNLALKVNKHIKLYGQLALDEFYLKEIRAHRGWWANKQAWQTGAKYFNAFGMQGLNLQVEYNEVRPYTYSHGIPLQNYAHAGLPLAHPAGSNFREFLFNGMYSKNKWQFGFQARYLYQGLDSSAISGNYGSDIFKSYTGRAKEYGNVVGQGNLHKTLQSQLRVAYLLYEKAQVWLELGYVQYSVSSLAGYKLENPYLYLNLRSRLWNRYRDY